MNEQAQKAFDELKAKKVPVFITDQFYEFVISAEDYCPLPDGSEALAADYYLGFFPEREDPETGKIINAFGIRQDIHDVLDKYNLHADWINPDTVGVYLD